MSIKMPDASGSFEKEPNVVPMIDIMLVLLIIFMMQIPLNRSSMDMQVPQEEEQEQQENEPPPDQIVLELLADGSYAINKDPVLKSALTARLRGIYDNRPAKIMFIRTAANRRYREVIEAMDIARGAGVQVIGYAPPPPEAQ